MTITAWFWLLFLAPAPQDPGVKLPVEEFVLDNGMRVLVVERHEVPRVYASLWWRVGSVNERPGLTGLSHFFEHMMFMGTETIGTTDPKRDAELNDSIEKTMTAIREVKLRRLEASRRGIPPTPEDETRFQELWKQYLAAVEEQKKITIPEHLSKIFQANGGTDLNATTSLDRTNYFVELPSNKIELFFWLESDRFARPVFRSFYPERDVVKEERRMRYESTPTGLLDEALGAMFWQSHPYGWPTIGWMSDIDQYMLSDAQEYFRTHYSPQNATAIFVGDVTRKEVERLARQYFGRLKRFESEPPAIVTQESEQQGERRITAEVDAQSELTIRWHGPSGVHADSPACDLLMTLLSGRSGRLYRPLVEEKELALDVQAWYWSLRYGGVLNLSFTPREGADFAALENETYAILEQLRTEGVGDRELQKAKNQMLANLARDLKTLEGVTQQLGYYETIGTHRDFAWYWKTLPAVTSQDIRRCVETYLKPAGRNVLVLRRKEKKS